ncbi:hypothetical protein [Methanococcoides vulcani]|nr:hypothetical protein [Methanococcoides vulcani]
MKTVMFIFLLVLFLPLSSAQGLDFDSERSPLLRDNNSPIIQDVYGSYVLTNNTSFSGKIKDFKDSNVAFNFTFNFTSGSQSIKIQDKIINPESSFFFRLDYVVSPEVHMIEAFSFNLGLWPERLTSPTLSTLSTGPLAVYNEDKVLIFPTLPNSSNYLVWKNNGSTIISIITTPKKEQDSLHLDIMYLDKETETYRNEVTNLGFLDEKIDVLLYEPTSAIRDISLHYENGTSQEIDFSDPEDVVKWSFENVIVKNGSAQWGSPYFTYNQFSSTNETFESISFDEALKLNSSEWLYDGKQFFRIFEGNIEEVTVDYSIDGIFHYILVTQSQIVPKIVIECKDKEINQLSLKYNQSGTTKIETINANDDKIIFNEPLLLEGSSFYFPFDSYQSKIYAINPPSLKEKKSELPFVDGSRFEGDAHFKRDKIEFEMTSRKDIKCQYWLSLLFFSISFTLLLFWENNTNDNRKKILEIISIIFVFIGNQTFLVSIGTILFLIIAVFIVFLKRKPFFKNCCA